MGPALDSLVANGIAESSLCVNALISCAGGKGESPIVSRIDGANAVPRIEKAGDAAVLRAISGGFAAGGALADACALETEGDTAAAGIAEFKTEWNCGRSDCAMESESCVVRLATAGNGAPVAELRTVASLATGSAIVGDAGSE